MQFDIACISPSPERHDKSRVYCNSKAREREIERERAQRRLGFKAGETGSLGHQLSLVQLLRMILLLDRIWNKWLDLH